MVFRKLLGSSREVLLKTFDRAFGGDGWRPLLDFVSPSFFDVVPLRDLLAEGRGLVANATDATGRARVEADVARALASANVDVALSSSHGSSGAPVPGSLAPGSPARGSGSDAGQRVLEIYFAQLFGAEAAFIDLRAAAFSTDATGWTPGPYFVRWSPEFLEALRALYAGFYRGEDADFRAALAALDLSSCHDVFLKHFGEDPENVVFERATFVSTFHEVFSRCRDQGVRLQPGFLPLGIYLAALHEHLAALGGGPFRVRTAFESATKHDAADG